MQVRRLYPPLLSDGCLVMLAVICRLLGEPAARKVNCQAKSLRACPSAIARISRFEVRTTCNFCWQDCTTPTQPPMASLSRSALLPQCTSCIRRIARQSLDGRAPQQQIRSISKAAKEAERNIVVKLLKDVPRYGRAGMAEDTSIGQRAWLMATRLVRSSQPGHDAQSMVSRPRRRLRTVQAIEAAEGPGGGHAKGHNVRRTSGSRGGR